MSTADTYWYADSDLIVGDWGDDQIVVYHAGSNDTFLLDESGSAVLLALREACGTLTDAEITSRVAEPGTRERDQMRQVVAEHLAELERRALVHRVPA